MTIKVVHRHNFLQHHCTQLEAINKRQTKERETRHKFATRKGIFVGPEGGEDDVLLKVKRGKDISFPEIPAKPAIETTLPSMPLIRRQVTFLAVG